jgi:hypothetical protein
MDEPVDHSRRRAALALLGVAVVAMLIAGGVYWATSGNSPSKPAAAPPTTVSPVVTPPSTATPTPTPTPKPKPKPRIPHDFVGAAAPTAFTFTAKHYKIKATVCGMENVRPLDPPGEQHHTVCWVQHDFGHAPGTNGRGTTYVLGHAWGQDPLEVLNRISAPATRQLLNLKAHNVTRGRNGIPTYPLTVLNHDVLTLRTPNGTLNYTVRDAYAVAKEQAGYVNSLMAQNTPNRVVVITCAERQHVDYDYNIVVEAFLTSSRAIPKSNT